DLLDDLAEHNVGALVVSTDGESMLGIVSERDVVRKLRGLGSPREHTVGDIMTSDVFTCGPYDSLAQLLELSTEPRIRHIPWLDEGKLVGALSTGAAAKLRMEQLKFERDQLSEYVASGQPSALSFHEAADDAPLPDMLQVVAHHAGQTH